MVAHPLKLFERFTQSLFGLLSFRTGLSIIAVLQLADRQSANRLGDLRIAPAHRASGRIIDPRLTMPFEPDRKTLNHLHQAKLRQFALFQRNNIAIMRMLTRHCSSRLGLLLNHIRYRSFNLVRQFKRIECERLIVAIQSSAFSAIFSNIRIIGAIF